jgi:hypothetical protein
MGVNKSFGFVVSKTDYKYGPEQEPDEQGRMRYVEHKHLDPPKWWVYLPHQCEEWTIAGSYSYDYAPVQEEAIAELERFIAEAQQALAALRKAEQFGRRE